MLKIFTSDDAHLTVEKAQGAWKINNEVRDFDIKSIGKNKFHIITQNQSISAEIIEVDEISKVFTIKINGKTATFQAKTEMDLLLEKMGIKAKGSGEVKEIKAPMPGQVLDLFCKEGDTVQKGDKVMILEAMKMENILKSPGEGKIKSIKVAQGDNVEKNQLMIVFE